MQAIVLAAGAGTRLRAATAVKPLAPLRGRPLIVHVAERLVAAGVTELVVVTGYRAPLVEAALAEADLPASLTTVRNPDWTSPNGVSVLAAAPFLRRRALLVMADHLIEPALYRRVATQSVADGELALGIDRNLENPWIDPLDVTRVATSGERIVGIGKLLDHFDCFDTGVFSIDTGLMEALATLPSPSLSDGVRALAAHGRASVLDCTGLKWLDVDDAGTYELARAWVEAPAETV